MTLGLFSVMLFFNSVFSTAAFAAEDIVPAAITGESAASEASSYKEPVDASEDESSLEGEDSDNSIADEEASEGDESEDAENLSDTEESEEMSDESPVEASLEAIEDDSDEAALEDSEELLIEEEKDDSLVMADAYSGSCGKNATWKYDQSSKTLTISGSGAMENYKFLSTDSTGIVSTTAPWDKYRKDISYISISKNITAIGSYAFCGVAFRDIIIPETVETIEEGAFDAATFGKVTNSSSFLKGVKKVGDSAFRAATFHDVTFDLSSAEYIGSYAFDIDNGRTSNCSTSFAFSDNLKYLGDYAFDGIAPKSSVLRFPSTMEYIGEYPFNDTESLKGEVVFPVSLTKISNGVFDNTGITSVIFGDRISEVSEHAFDGNNSLTKITFKGDFPGFKQKTFSSVKSKLTVYYPLDSESWFKGVDTLAYDSSKVEFVPVGDSTTVTFIGLDGKTVSTQKVALGGKLSDPTSLAANSSNIGGWYADRKLQYELNKWDFTAPVKHKMTLYAGQKYTGHKVVFFPENGKDYTVQVVEDGKDAAEVIPEYDGYRFAGWYTDRNYKHIYSFKFNPVTRDIALYARWETYRPYIICDNSKYRYIPDFELRSNEGESVWDRAASSVAYYEKDGYARFLGWFFDADFKKPVPSNHTVIKDTRIYGKWELVSRKVTLDRMDGTKPEEIEVPYKEILKLPADIQRRGYTFKGWSENADGTNILKYDDVEITEDATYYAVWELNEIRLDYYAVYEDKNPEYAGWDYKDACRPVEYDVNSEDHKDHFYGYEFDGWYYDAKLTKPVGTDLIYENTTIYAKTHKKVYDVVINPDNGEEPYVIRVKHGEKPDVSIPVKKGYEFVGWLDVNTGSQWNSINEITGPASYEACWRVAGYVQNIVISGVKDMTYTGSAITFPGLKITDNGKELVSGQDYTVKYSNNVKVSTDKAPAVITINYKGLYQGKSTVSYKIKEADLEELKKAGSITSGFETTYLAYNGKVQKSKPSIYLTVNGKKTSLKENRDYRLVYENANPKAEDYDADAFRAVGTYRIIARGMGSYKGKLEFTEVITADKLVGKLTVTGLKKSYAYTGNKVYPAFAIKDGKEVVGTFDPEAASDVDVFDSRSFIGKAFNSDVLSCDIVDNTNVGTASIVLTAKSGKGYAGSRTLNFNITGTPISKAVFDGFKSSFDYDDGNELKQEGVLLYKNATYKKNGNPEGLLKEHEDYEVSYSGSTTDIGKVTVTYTGKNGYTGAVKKTYTINGRSISKAKVSGITGSSFTGSAIRFGFNEGDETKDGFLMLQYPVSQKETKKLTGIDADKYEKLSAGDKRSYDYVVSYSGNVNKGTARAVIEGVNGYQGRITKTFKIGAFDLENAEVLNFPETVGYTKKGCRPSNYSVRVNLNGTARTLFEGNDYKVSVSNNKKVGAKAVLTITGIGNYSGKIKKTYTVSKATIDAFKVVIEAPAYSDKTGNFVCKVTAYDSEWTKLTQGVDYKVVYTSGNELNPRKDKVSREAAVTCTVKGMNSFNENSGGRSFTFGLKDFKQTGGNCKPPVPLSSCKFTIGDYIYTGKAICPDVASIQVKNKNGEYISSDNFNIVGYESNVNVGTAAIIIKGINPDMYSGTYKLKFRILPRTVDSENTEIK